MIRSVLIVVVLGLLSACSAIRLGYDHADKLLAMRMDDWFDLADPLRASAHERMHRVLAWHRREELPRYAAILNEAERRLADPAPLQAAELLALQRRVTQRLLVLGAQVADEFADVLAQAGPEQRKRLLARIAESNEDFREDFLDARPAAVRKRRIGQTTERYEFWLGRLDEAQHARIEQWIDARPLDASWRLGVRQARQQAFVGILEQAAGNRSGPQAATRLKAFFADLETPAAPALLERHRMDEQARSQLTADLFNMASPAQRDKARVRLKGLARDCMELAAKAPARQANDEAARARLALAGAMLAGE